MSNGNPTQHRLAKFFWEEFIYAGHLQCLGALSIVHVTSVLFNLDIDGACLLISYILFYPIYLYDRYTGIESDALTSPARANHFRSYKKFIPLLLTIAVVVPFFLIVLFANWLTFVFCLAIMLLGFSYENTLKAFTKKIPALKNILSIVFVLMILLPIFYKGLPLDAVPWSQLVILGSYIYVMSIWMQIFLDIKDIKRDGQRGLRTVPVLVGEVKALNVVLVSKLVLPLIFPLLACTIYSFLPPVTWAFSISLPHGIVCDRLVRRKNALGYALASAEYVMLLVAFPLLGFLFN